MKPLLFLFFVLFVGFRPIGDGEQVDVMELIAMGGYDEHRENFGWNYINSLNPVVKIDWFTDQDSSITIHYSPTSETIFTKGNIHQVKHDYIKNKIFDFEFQGIYSTADSRGISFLFYRNPHGSAFLQVHESPGRVLNIIAYFPKDRKVDLDQLKTLVSPADFVQYTPPVDTIRITN